MKNGFQKGDVPLKIEGRTYRLRLTLGALAEIETRFGVKGPLALADKIRNLGCENRCNSEVATLLECLMCSVDNSGKNNVPAMVRSAKCASYMSAIATLFEEAFK